MPREFDPGDKVRRWQVNLKNPAKALKQVGALMVSESQKAFTDQRFGQEQWEPRSPINVFGILADFHAGKKTPPARRFESRPALKDTGRLGNSIAFQVSGDTVTVGSNLPYAGVHHTGGEVESVPLSEQVQHALGEWLLKIDDDTIFNRLAPLINKRRRGDTLKMQVPERRLVGITKQTIADIKEVVGVEIMEVD